MSQGRRGLIDSDEPNSKRRRTGLQKEERNLQSDIGDPHSDAGIADKLPDGFFDDPKMEAAVKNSVYINPVDAEIVKFNKEIEQENQKAEKSVEEDLIEIQKERNLEEIDSQIQKWAKVEELQKKADEFKGKILKSKQDSDSEPDSDNDDLDTSNTNLSYIIDGFSDWKKKSSGKG